MRKKTCRNDEIAAVIGEEKKRVRQPLSAEMTRSRKEKLRIVSDALRLQTEAEFVKAMQSYGLTDEELRLALAAWREGPS